MKNMKRFIVFALTAALSIAGSFAAFAAEGTSVKQGTDNVTVINVFDPSDPHLVAIVDPAEDSFARTTSRPTSHYDLESEGQYKYSAYSNNNVMWSKYIFDTNFGSFRVYGTTNGTKAYRVVFHNCDNGKDYYYAPELSSEFDAYEYNVGGGIKPSSFYFGIDTTVSKSAVSVNGFVETY